MSLSPRVLLSIDYEPWFALFRHYDHLRDSNQRRELDAGFTRLAIDPILAQLGNSKASLYLVGEITDWYPEVPQKIVAGGHELGLHCHIHRPLVNVHELADDLAQSMAWCRQYGVRGYRAPMVGIHEEAYALLERCGFEYSSSIYAPTGTLLKRGKIWEIPVSTVRLRASTETYTAPRDFSSRLLLRGEFERGCPPWKFRGTAKPLAQRQIGQLDDDAVGVELEILSLRVPLAAKGDDFVDPQAHRRMGFDRQSPLPHRCQQFEMVRRRSVRRTDVLIDERLEAAAADQRGIEISHRSRRDVARIRIERLAAAGAFLIDPLEGGARQKHLTTHFEARRRTAAQRQRNGPDRPDVGSDFLAAKPVTAGCPTNQPSVLVR